MKFKKILSSVIALAMTASMAVMPMTAKAGALYNSYTTSGEKKMLTVNLDDFMEADEVYEFSFNVKPERIDVSNSIRIDLGHQGNVTSAGNYGVFYLYDNGKNALGKSDWGTIGNVEAYKDAVLAEGIDFTMVWDTGAGVVDITAGFPGKDYSYTYTPGVVAEGKSYGKFIVWSESASVKVTDLVIEKQGDDVIVDEDAPLYQKDSWTISGEHNYLWTGSDIGMTADGKYVIEFGVKAPTGNPSFFFDWRDGSNVTRSNCSSWNYKALVGIYDDGNNDCLALGTAPSWVGTLGRSGKTNEYKYTIVWDIPAKTFDMTLDYKKTADGTTGTYKASYTATSGFSTGDVLKFATNGGKATITDLKISKWKPAEYYLESHKTTGAGNAFHVSLDEYFITGEKYELTWNMTPDSIANQSIRADILWGNTASQGSYGFFLLYDGGVNALGMGNHSLIGNVASQTAEVATKGVDFKMIWDTATGIADITVTFPTGKAYTYQYNAGVIGSGQKYGSLYLQGPHTAVTINNLSIKPYVEPVVEKKPAPTVQGTSVQEVDMEDYAGKAWDIVINNFDGANTYSANFTDGEEEKNGDLDFENVEADGGSVAFAIFLHTDRVNAIVDVVKK